MKVVSIRDLLAYIALHGRSTWASLNTYYAVLEESELRPEVIWIVTESTFESQLPVLQEGFEVISIGFDLKPKVKSLVLPEGDIVEAGLEIGGLVESLKKDYRVALDITSARKPVVAGALLATADNKPDHIFYLMIDTLEGVSKPYPMIPRQHQQLHDLRQETRSRPR